MNLLAIIKNSIVINIVEWDNLLLNPTNQDLGFSEDYELVFIKNDQVVYIGYLYKNNEFINPTLTSE